MSISVQDLNLQLSVLETELNSTRTSFEEFITDQTVPLCVRWDVFIDAPSYIKNSCFCSTFPEDLTGCFDFDIVEELGDSFVNVNPITEIFCLIRPPVDLDKTKEIILSHNIGTYYV